MNIQNHLKDSSNNFLGIPPFPEDVPTAPLLRLSSAKLLAGDPAEYQRLFQASLDIGFFYLDLSDTKQGSSLLSDADNLFQVGERLFELTLEEKRKYDFSKKNSYFGYKAQGAAVVDKHGNLDRNEFYNAGLHQTHPFSYTNLSRYRFPKTTSWASVIHYQHHRSCTIVETN
jgi:isopenicillin N synthase-like dioxygenase